MSANERRKGREVWAIARRVAAPVIPLLLGATATALLLDSGTVHLPPIGAGPGSNSANPAKVVVAAPTTTKATSKRHVSPTHSGPSVSAPTGSTALGRTTGAALDRPFLHYQLDLLKQVPEIGVPASSSGTSTASGHSRSSSSTFHGRLPPTPRQPGAGPSTPLIAPPGPLAAAAKHPEAAAPPKPAEPPKPAKPPKPKHHGPPGKPAKPSKLHGPPGHDHHGPSGKPAKPKPPKPPKAPKHHASPGKARKEDKVKPRHVAGDKGHGPHGEGHGSHGRGHDH